MGSIDLLQFAVFIGLILLATPILGAYMARVFSGEKTPLSVMLRPVERIIYKICGVREDLEEHWLRYAGHLLLFSLIGTVVTYAMLRLQQYLPLNPRSLPGMSPDLAMNTAISFNTNTNWQAYSGENTVSHFNQMAGLAVHNFLSAATGLAVAIALVRGFARRTAKTIGNFYVDLTRSILYVMLPIAIVVAVVLVWQGVPQTLTGAVEAQTVEGGRQTIALGPVASQEAIKDLGSNGGGFFAANSAHPYENPTPLSNFIENLLIFLIPAALVDTYGRMIGRRKQAYAVFGAMGILFVLGLTTWRRWRNRRPTRHLTQIAGYDAAQGNMEGKEVRFGVADSVLWAVTTTDAPHAVRHQCPCMDSFTPLGGMVPTGQYHAGLRHLRRRRRRACTVSCCMSMLAVFIAGLMVGRTPEYVGKKIEIARGEARDLSRLLAIDRRYADPVTSDRGRSRRLGAGRAWAITGPHGLTEILYAFASSDANNGSSFAGFQDAIHARSIT